MSLAGCSSPPPAGYTPAELQEWVELQNQSRWAGMFPTATTGRPEVAVERFLNSDDYTVYECMADAGVPIEFGLDGSVSWSGSVVDGVDPAAIAQYTCEARFPLYPPQAGYFTDEQHAYLYDYYQDVLVPCLIMEGYTVEGDVPTRDEFNDLTSVDSFWSPYSFIDYPVDYEEQNELVATCPHLPFRAPVAD